MLIQNIQFSILMGWGKGSRPISAGEWGGEWDSHDQMLHSSLSHAIVFPHYGSLWYLFYIFFQTSTSKTSFTPLIKHAQRLGIRVGNETGD